MVTVASAPSSGGVVWTRMPWPLPTVTYQVASATRWATVKWWSRDQAAWMT